jgi:twitching motility protein PilT
METVALEPMQDKVLAAVKNCALFRALKPDQFPQLVKAAELVRFQPGEHVVKQGEESDSFYVVVDGLAAVQVEKGGEPVEIGEVPQPNSVGEVGLLLGEARTASVLAKTEVTALRFSGRAFEAMFQKIPNFGMGLSAGLAYRLQQVSGKVQLPAWDAKQTAPSDEVLDLLPVDLMQRHRIVPLRSEGNLLTLGLVDDPSSLVMDAVRRLLPGLDIRPVKIESGFFNEVLQRRSGVKEWKATAAPVPVTTAAAPSSPKLDKLLARMVGEGASDLHLSAGHQPRWRVDGDMRTIADAPVLEADEALELLEPVMEKRHREQFAADNDVDYGYSLSGVARFRINMFRDSRGVGAVLRLIPSKIMSFEQLSLPPVLKALCDYPKGLVLVTGPTGSGKSTTLAAMLDYVNKTRDSHMITLEDPIEFVHQSAKCLINQREVGGHTTSFARALRAALREDPDIVLVGEMRDRETISAALETANTGHLVFATLHTNNAISAVDRIIDQFPADQQSQIRSVLADTLRGVVAQTLCKKIGGGRVAAIEVLVVTFGVANLIREAKAVQIPSIMQSHKGLGMALLNDELAKLVDARKIEMAEALSSSVDKEDLNRRYRSGVTLAADPQDPGRFRVMGVAPNTPGAEVEFERGDTIVEVDGKACTEISLDEIRQYFRADGRRIYTVDRGGKRRKVTLDLRR